MARAKRKKSGATFGSRTDVGCVREHNEDSLAVAPPLYVVCDGMGGENCGQIASSLAVRAFLDELHAVLRTDMTTEQLREAVSFCVSKANAAVKRHAQEHTECHGMGTTLVSAVQQPRSSAMSATAAPTASARGGWSASRAIIRWSRA